MVAKWLAFKNYLKNIKQYADLENSGDIFEGNLAYAIAFGPGNAPLSTTKFSQAPATVLPWYMPYPPIHTPMGGVRYAASRQ